MSHSPVSTPPATDNRRHTKSLYLSVDPDLHQRLLDAAQRDARSLSSTARLLLSRGLAQAEANADQSLAS